jgi:hypothetical protein
MKNALIYFPRIALAILVLMLNSYSLKAQTKEETIKWIVEKINKYGETKTDISEKNDEATKTSFTSDGGKIKIKYIDYTTSAFSFEENIDFNEITNAEKISAKTIVLTSSRDLIATQIGPGEQNGHIVICKGGCNMFRLYLNWDAEPNLVNRMEKAFTTLISFSSPKEIF